MLIFSSPLICRCTAKQSHSVIRRISFIKHIKPRSVLLDKSKHNIIYEFPYISSMSYFIRTKFWIPTFVSVIMPVGLLFDGVRGPIFGCFLSSWIHSAVVHQMSKFAENTIGKIYVTEKNETEDVIISAVDRNGNRIDRYHKPSDLVVCDFSSKLSHALGFIKIYAQNCDLTYQLNVNNCKIYDQKSYCFLIGNKWGFQKY